MQMEKEKNEKLDIDSSSSTSLSSTSLSSSSSSSSSETTTKTTTNESNENNKTPLSSSGRGGEKSIDIQRGGPLLAICASGICISYMYYGIAQEKLFSRDAEQSIVKDVGPIATFLLAIQTIMNVLVAYIWIHIPFQNNNNINNNSTAESSSSPLNHGLMLLTAFFYFGAMSLSNESLLYVSYPTVVLAKSCKLIPTMLMGSLVERRSYSIQEWTGAAFITLGITIFNISRMTMEQDEERQQQKDSPHGILLLFISLIMDGMLAACQGILMRGGITGALFPSVPSLSSLLLSSIPSSSTNKQQKQKQQKHHHQLINYRPPTAIETMLYINLYATFFMIPASIYSGQFHNGITLLFKTLHPTNNHDVAWNIFLLTMTTATGQIFIFLTIFYFQTLMCTTITTTRKFFTILISVYTFGHQFTVIQWMCIGMVFSGLYLGIMAKFQYKRNSYVQQEKEEEQQQKRRQEEEEVQEEEEKCQQQQQQQQQQKQKVQ